jgi:tetratricopeptide (TPR) repeat protein
VSDGRGGGDVARPGAGGSGWHRLEALFADALELPPQERDAFVDDACAGDAALAARLRALLAAHERMGSSAGFLEGLDPERAAALVTAAEQDEREREAIGRYRVLRRIGAGGMGVVYLAVDPRLDRQVAVKLLPAHLSGDAAAQRRFIAEARAASALEHPNIATVYEIAETDDGRLFIAMAYCEGETLQERLRAGALDVDTALGIAAGLADALVAAHGRGIVHRDIKPGNVLLASDGGVRLLDFGVAKMLAAGVTRTGATLGTIAYMSPEQTRGSDVDHRSDIWSLGVLLFEMLAGRRPFDGDATDAIIYGIRNDEPAPLAGVPADVADIVARCLSKEPDARYPSAAALLAALYAARGVAGDVRRRSDPGARRPRRARLAVAAAAVLVTAAAALGVAAAMRALPGMTEASGRADDFAERGWVLVAEPEAEDDAADVALAVREALTVDLQQSGFVNVYGRFQITPVLQRMGLPPTSALELPLALDVAQRTGAGAVLAVTVSRLGPQYVLSGRAIRPADGVELFAVRSAGTPDNLVQAVEALSREVRRRLGEERGELRRSRALPEVTTRSLEALKLYAAAEQATNERNITRAATLLDAALAEDPTFAMAHRAAGILATNQLRFGDGVRHVTRAYELRDRLSDRERWHVEALYFTFVDIDPGRAVDAYERVLARYPDDVRAAINVGSTLNTWLNDNEPAWLAISQIRNAGPQPAAYYINAIHLAYVTGRHDDAERLAAAADENGFGDVASRWRIGRAFASGAYRTATAMCDSVLAGPPRPPSLADDREICGSIDIATGRLVIGAARLRQIQREYMEARRYRNVAHVTQALAVGHILRNEPDRAIERLTGLLERVPGHESPEPDRFITRTSLQLQAALLGRPDIVARIGEVYPLDPDYRNWMTRVGTALVQAAVSTSAGDGAAALDTLRAAIPGDRVPVGWRMWNELVRGLAFESIGRNDSAAVRLGRAADPAFLALEFTTKDRIYLPLILRRLADVEDARGNTAGAADARRRLIELWADADAALQADVAELRERALGAETGTD